MKKIILIFLLSHPFQSLYSQDLSIELSIEWKFESTSLNLKPFSERDTSLFLPYLLITYKNNTPEPIYFSKVIEEDYRYPLLPSESTRHARKDIALGLKNHRNYSTEIFAVQSEQTGVRHFGGMWEVIPFEERVRSGPYTTDLINYNISRIHLVLKTQSLLDELKTGKRLACFNHCCKEVVTYRTADSIVNVNNKTIQNETFKYEFASTDFGLTSMDSVTKQQFVFIDNNASFTQKVSLIGFYILGGTYHFKLTDEQMYDHVFGDSYRDKKTERWNYKKILLPKEIDGYRLYTGKFVTNSVEFSVNHPD